VNRPGPGIALIAGCLVLAGLAALTAPGDTPVAAQERDALIARGKARFVEMGCHGCHTIAGMGTPIAPDLSRTGLKYREADLARWLKDPAAQETTRHMPALGLGDGEARELAAYLASVAQQ
jgi:mono/diheme cytochrome c family protein